jgi:hypothetical protein
MLAFSEQFLEDFSVATRLAISNYYSPEEMLNIEVEIRFTPKQLIEEGTEQDFKTEAFIVTPTLQYGCHQGEGPGCPDGWHYGTS